MPNSIFKKQLSPIKPGDPIDYKDVELLKKLALDINIKTITPAAISRARGKSSKLIIRLSVKTINGYKAIARKGKTAQEVFISTDLSKDELKKIIDIYNRK